MLLRYYIHHGGTVVLVWRLAGIDAVTGTYAIMQLVDFLQLTTQFILELMLVRAELVGTPKDLSLRLLSAVLRKQIDRRLARVGHYRQRLLFIKVISIKIVLFLRAVTDILQISAQSLAPHLHTQQLCSVTGRDLAHKVRISSDLGQ